MTAWTQDLAHLKHKVTFEEALAMRQNRVFGEQDAVLCPKMR